MVTVGLLATVGAVVTGCFAPGDPEGVAIGMRVDAGVLTVYVPLCPGESVKSAEVDLSKGNGKRVLTVEEPIEPESKVVRLDTTAWRRVSGSFQYTGQEFGMNVSSLRRRMAPPPSIGRFQATFRKEHMTLMASE
jgi:hypothetical protein